MSQDTLPEDLIRFINTSIPGIPFLEALLLLRTEPGKSWDVESVGNRLYLPATMVTDLLKSLCAAGMATEALSQFRYQPRSDELRDLIDRLSECYQNNLVEVTRIIHSSTGNKAQIFADAFKWKRDP